MSSSLLLRGASSFHTTGPENPKVFWKDRVPLQKVKASQFHWSGISLSMWNLHNRSRSEKKPHSQVMPQAPSLWWCEVTGKVADSPGFIWAVVSWSATREAGHVVLFTARPLATVRVLLSVLAVFLTAVTHVPGKKFIMEWGFILSESWGNAVDHIGESVIWGMVSLGSREWTRSRARLSNLKACPQWLTSSSKAPPPNNSTTFLHSTTSCGSSV